jgi:hypothetical protein
MKRFFCVLTVVGLFSSITLAADQQLSGAWTFSRTDGVVGTVRLAGEYPSCTVYPAGNEENIFLDIGSFHGKSRSCFSTSLPSEQVIGQFELLSDGQIVSVQVVFGASFKELMQTFAELGEEVVGPIGGSEKGVCPASSTAFIAIPGWAVADPNEDIIGYCLIP